MANVIQIKRSATATNVPLSLAAGELAINTADEKLFYANAATTVKEVDLQAVTSALQNVVEDTTPQLGGTLDVNSQSIQFPTTTISDVLDEDNMVSDSATALATQQSIKAYVDTEISAALVSATEYKGTADASAVDVDTATGNTVHQNGDMYRVTTAGSTAFGFQLNVGDFVIYNGTTWDRIDAVDPTVSGTASRISVTGDEATGFTVDIDASYVGQTSITTLGTITTGTWNGTDIAIADGGTGASTAGDARTNLGLAIGSDVQAYDAGLASIAGLTTAADTMIYTTALDTYATTTISAFGRSLVDDADAATARTTLNVDVAGTDNSTDVTLAGAYDYLTISGQEITLNQVDLATDVTGALDGGTF